MAGLDYKKALSDLYTAKVGQASVVYVPKMNFIMADGHGDPNTSEEYLNAIQTLYPVAYTLKFLCKNKYDQDFSVMPLEGLWWAEEKAEFSADNKSNWLWTAMIMQPPFVTADRFEEAIDLIRERRGGPPLLDQIRFQSYDEGRAAQVMYVGPYAEEGPAIVGLHKFITAQDGLLDENTKHHHEIYLNDPRRTDPARLKTIIRQPF
jgi:hypothetical protein